MREVVMTTALVAVLVGCAPQVPMTYAQMVCADETGWYQAVTNTQPALSSWRRTPKRAVGAWRGDARACESSAGQQVN